MLSLSGLKIANSRSLDISKIWLKVFGFKTVSGEDVGDISASYSLLKGIKILSTLSPYLIDEYPILSIAASFANSPSHFKGLKELRVKESDRLELIKHNLENCGVKCLIKDDELFIDPKDKYTIKNNKIKTDFDHRIAMSFAIMGSLLEEDLFIDDSSSIKTSFPNFVECYNKVGGNIVE